MPFFSFQQSKGVVVDETLLTSQNKMALRVHFQPPGRGDVILDSLLLTVSMVMIDSEYTLLKGAADSSGAKLTPQKQIKPTTITTKARGRRIWFLCHHLIKGIIFAAFLQLE